MKADSNPALDALMAAPAIRQDRCGVCGFPTEANHHEPPKGMGGARKHDHTIALCGRDNQSLCHGHAHKHKGILRFRQAGDILYFKADEEAAVHINKRRRKAGMSRVAAGAEYPYTIFPDAEFCDESPEDGSELYELDRKWFAIDEVASDAAWTRACLIAQYREHFGSGTIGHANLVRHATEHLGVAKSEVTRLEHWLDIALVPLADRLGSSTKADLAWKVIQQGGDPQEVVAFCAANSVSAIRAEHFAAGERVTTPAEALDALCVWLADRPGEQIPPRTQAEWRAFARGESSG